MRYAATKSKGWLALLACAALLQVGAVGPSGTGGVVVSVQAGDAAVAPPGAVRVVARRSGAEPLSLPIGGPAAVLPVGAWELRALAEGYWGRPVVVQVTEGRSIPVALQLLPASTIRIPLGKAVPDRTDARLMARADAGLQGDFALDCRVSDGASECSAPAGRWNLRLASEGFVPIYHWDLSLVAARPLTLAPPTWVRGSSLLGQVVDTDGRPVAGARVTLLRDTGESAAGTTRVGGAPAAATNSQGYFQLGTLPAGRHRIRVSRGSVVAERAVVLFADRESRLEPRVELGPAMASIDVSVDPPASPGGQPWQVSVVSVGRPATVLGKGPADARGRWRLASAQPGAAVLLVADERGSTWRREELTVGKEPLRLALQLDPLRVVGEVRLGTGPLAGAEVTLIQKGRTEARFQTDDQGRFEGAAASPAEGAMGPWRVQIRAAEPVVTRLLLEVRPEWTAAGEAAFDIRLQNRKLRGRILDVDGTTAEFPVIVNLTRENGEPLFVIARTGSFEFAGLEPGSYHLVAEAKGKTSAVTPAELPESGPETTVDLRLARPTIFRGVTVTTAGHPLPDVGLFVYPASAPFESVPLVKSDSQGRFVAELPGSTKAVGVVAMPPQGFALKVARVAIPEAGEVPLVFEQGGGRLVLEGCAEAATADPAGALSIVVHAGYVVPVQDLLAWARRAGTVPDPRAGRIEIPALEAGPYKLCRASTQAEILALLPAEAGAERCSSGTLHAGGELALALPCSPG